ncbi:Zinc finger BED domain-containing protein 4 [Trametes pubescens]|uniref:Zinc finger BED domain-containing protein 4 n=1 Tax=Trametes pubescens TaxID=154538 RepID=A0A1M2VZP6_TRAPU|nr:Zinc finger BED domain-containing protein 4 [Trametes pubescens]
MPPPSQAEKRGRAVSTPSDTSSDDGPRRPIAKKPCDDPAEDDVPPADDAAGVRSSDVEEIIGGAVEDGVAAVAARAQRAAGTSGRKALTAADKKARFQERFADRTPEEALKELADSWRSAVYDHFKPPIVLPPKADGTIMHRFVCKRHPSKRVDRSNYEDSTGNLGCHILGCEPDDTPEVEQITAYGHGSTYSAARVRFYIAIWCSRHHRPYIIVEDKEFRQLLTMLYGKVVIPKRMTVARDIRIIHSDSKDRVIIHFQQCISGRIHICIDGWTSPNILAFLGITAHWHDNGKIRHVILDFVRLTNAHTGKYLAEEVIKCLESFGIEKKVMAVTCDNAESNTVMLKEMHALVPQFRGPRIRVRCFGHVLNLTVKAILSIFSKPGPPPGDADKEDEDADEHEAEAAEEIDAAREAADDAIIDALLDEDLDFELNAADLFIGRTALNKILTLSRKVWNSPNVRTELGKLATEKGLKSEVLIRAVRTRWNTVTEVIKRALEMKEVLGDLCDMHQFNKDKRGPRLRRFVLEDDEWTLLDEVHRLLDPFLYATKQISVSDRALVQDVIPYIDVLTSHVDTFRNDASLSPIVRAAAQRGREILDKYYKRTDETIVYRIAMILHPRYKLQYFRDADWEEDWITEALKLVRDEWTTNYKPQQAAADAQVASQAKGKGRAGPGTGRRSAQQSQQSTTDLFASISGAAAKAAKQDLLEAYLEEPPQPTVQDPLHYWNVILQTTRSPLAQMALDFLSIPATSTDAERAFSQGHLTVSRLRHSLGDESVRTGTVLGSWAEHPELVPEDEVVEVVKRHMRQGKDKAKALNAARVSAAAAASAAGASKAVASSSKATGSSSKASSAKASGSKAAAVIEIDVESE